jgi:hypothetical protein
MPVIDMVRLCEELPEIKVKETNSAEAPNLWRTHAFLMSAVFRNYLYLTRIYLRFNLLKPPGYVMHQQFNIQQLYALPTPYLCVLYLSENKQW